MTSQAQNVEIESSSLALTADILENLEIRNKPKPSKSENGFKRTEMVVVRPEKSTSLTLAERRKNNSPTSLKLMSINQHASEKVSAATSVLIEKLEKHQESCLVKQYLEKQVSLSKSDPRFRSFDPTPLLTTSCNDYYAEFIKNSTLAQARQDLFQQSLKNGGIDENARSAVWRSICQISSNSQICILYNQLLLDESPSPFDELIEKDLADQDPSVRRILKAYCVYDKRVGYCREMAYLVSPLLVLNMPENESFGVFVRLMEMYDMRNLFMLNMEGLTDCLHQFRTVLLQTCPQVDAHLHRLSIHPSMYASKWYLTLFSSSLPSRTHVMRLFDLVFLEGAVETAIRLSVLLLQKNKDKILLLNDPVQLSNFLSSDQVYHPYESDKSGDLLVTDIVSMRLLNQAAAAATENQSNETEQDKKKRVHQMVTTLGSSNTNNKTSTTNTTSQLQQQIDDLIASMSQLQKEHNVLSETNMSMKIKEMEGEAAQLKLAKKNAVLEKRVKKYKVKLANASVTTTETEGLISPAVADAADQQQTNKSRNKRQDQFVSFVESLRDSGDFGTLIAGALAQQNPHLPSTTDTITDSNNNSEEEQQQEQLMTEEEDAVSKLEATLQNVTSELVAVKLDHFSTTQRYEQHCARLEQQLHHLQESQTALVQKVIYLESELEDVSTERDQIYADQEEVLAATMVAKKTSAELQLEKMGLIKDVERLEQQAKELQEEKESFFMPRDTFSEEVFAAHTILFGTKEPNNKRHSVDNMNIVAAVTTEMEEYKAKFVESELRCRELEKYLAETKVKLAEFESGMSPRTSIHLQRRASQHQGKRNSTASLSMLARVNTPTSPRERRESTESYASSTTSLTSISSNYNSKRSSVYSRIWNAFGTATTPATPTNVNAPNNALSKTASSNQIMCASEPQIV